ncbi:PAS domain-containing sensor histidine kinase [Rufibacter tibetensis]|uniref:PAS domain-containing sensor histidine kinase n=1 Tax=Rufibacter tibetensis TaxID=512763 RepID=UPI00078357DD|nr:HAMP domain-containing sensor histidine kinase [Rufibacter tibetensis]
MSTQNKLEGNLIDKQRQLEEQNRVLREENKQLRADIAEALFKLKEQIAIEDRYEESQSRFETIFSQSKLGNKIIAPDLKIIQVNKSLQDMLGYSEQELVGSKVIDFAHPDFVHHWVDLQEHLWTRQIPSFQIETCLIKKDGAGLWVQVTSMIFRDNGANLGYTIVENIKDRKALEQNLKKLYEAQETILHMVAHDLKNPINNISLLTEYLKENLVNSKDLVVEEKKESLTFIGLISETCKKAFAIIKDLLFIGDMNPNAYFEKTELNGFFQTELAALGVDAKKKGVEVSFSYPELPVYANINQEKFSRVMENLLSNAVKFTKPGGKVDITLTEQGKYALLHVKDNGIGIPEKLKSTVFDKFTNANRQGTEGESTTGLGLFIVKQIVNLHQGRIWMESQENVGTSFFIELERSQD